MREKKHPAQEDTCCNTTVKPVDWVLFDDDRWVCTTGKAFGYSLLNPELFGVGAATNLRCVIIFDHEQIVGAKNKLVLPLFFRRASLVLSLKRAAPPPPPPEPSVERWSFIELTCSHPAYYSAV